MRKYEVSINKKRYSVVVKTFSLEAAELEINGKTYQVKMDGPIQTLTTGSPTPSIQAPAGAPASPAIPVASPPTTRSPNTGSSVKGAEMLKAPIPGSVLEIRVKKGDAVKSGQTLVKMEAMKMENEINSPIDGTVQSVKVRVGDAVNQGQDLIEIA